MAERDYRWVPGAGWTNESVSLDVVARALSRGQPPIGGQPLEKSGKNSEKNKPSIAVNAYQLGGAKGEQSPESLELGRNSLRAALERIGHPIPPHLELQKKVPS